MIRTTCFWNIFFSQKIESQIFLKSLGARKPKGLIWIAKIGEGHWIFAKKYISLSNLFPTSCLLLLKTIIYHIYVSLSVDTVFSLKKYLYFGIFQKKTGWMGFGRDFISTYTTQINLYKVLCIPHSALWTYYSIPVEIKIWNFFILTDKTNC